MTAAGPEYHVFSYLLRRAIPMVVNPPGPPPSHWIQLRGVVFTNDGRARVAFWMGDSTDGEGIAFEFFLADSDFQLNADAALDWLRTINIPGLARMAAEAPQERDCHLNVIIKADAAGFSASMHPLAYDHSIFSILSTLVHGGGFPWFEDVYTCTGFMLTGKHRWRIYIRVTSSGETVGIDVPLTGKNGLVVPNFGEHFPQELASVVRQNDLDMQPLLGTRDEYCSKVYAMDSWFGPDTV